MLIKNILNFIIKSLKKGKDKETYIKKRLINNIIKELFNFDYFKIKFLIYSRIYYLNYIKIFV